MLSSSLVGQPSLVDWLLGTLETRGPQTLDELGGRLPDTNWAQLLLAVDSLSRSGQVSLALVGRADYVVALSSAGASALEGRQTELVGAKNV
jgi:hypothetical protein